MKVISMSCVRLVKVIAKVGRIRQLKATINNENTNTVASVSMLIRWININVPKLLLLLFLKNWKNGLSCKVNRNVEMVARNPATVNA